MSVFECSLCLKLKDESEFHKNKRTKNGLCCWCKRCKSNYSAKYNEVHKEIKKEQDKKRHERIRMIALYIYSNGKMECANCKCDEIDVLSIDHINNDGYKSRNAYFYYWLQKYNYPNDFQVLCRNCNWLKHLNYIDKKIGV